MTSVPYDYRSDDAADVPADERATDSSTPLRPDGEPVDYLHDGTNLASWLLTTDHKRIALLYMASITLFFAVGGVAATLMRLELLTPTADLVKPDVYNRLFTLHGVIMVWFFLIPSIPTVLGNFLLPLMIGAKDLAFPRLNLASWYVFMIGGSLAITALLLGGVDTGWTFYTPYSTAFSNTYVVLTVAGIFVSGFSSIFTGLNFIVTTHALRCPGMTWFRMPLFVWSLYSTSLILVLATPVLAITLVLVAVERLTGAGIFDPAKGGDPILFQHLFWFYSHPAVYIMILPGFGVVSEIVTCFSHKRVFGYYFIAFASVAIALLGFLVWGHHMFVSGQSVYAGLVFSLLSFLIAVPSAIKVFNWTATLYKGSVQLDTPMLYALGFIGLFTLGGLTGLVLASTGIDMHVTDTYFVVAHFHYIMVGGMVLAYLGGRALLVPQGHGPALQRVGGAVRGVHGVRGVQPDVLPAVHPGLPRDAPAVRLLPGRVAVAARPFDRRGEHPRGRVRAAADLPAVGVEVRPAGGQQPVARRGAGVDHAQPAGRAQLRADAGVRPRGVQLRRHPAAGRVVPAARATALPGAARDDRPRGGRTPRPGDGRVGRRRRGRREGRRPMTTADYPSPLARAPFDDRRQQHAASTLGMWVFLGTELLLFGGMIAAYTVYRVQYPAAFAAGSRHLYEWIGAANTAVLLTSSFAAALAVRAAEVGNRRHLMLFIALTVAIGSAFLALKGVEYYLDVTSEHLLVGYNFMAHHAGEPGAPQQALFLCFYWTMTGIHAVHMTIGLGVWTALFVQAWRGRLPSTSSDVVEVTGMYWHFVDLVWLFLLPLLYLAR